jgi:hypothetical protein
MAPNLSRVDASRTPELGRGESPGFALLDPMSAVSAGAIAFLRDDFYIVPVVGGIGEPDTATDGLVETVFVKAK